jgi:branched-chain amino acid transport system permease protein
MELAVQTLINTLILAAMYIIVSLGFAFLFNMLGVFNIAHSSIYMVSGYLGYVLIGQLGINQWLGLILVIIVMALFGVFLERVCFRPFFGDFNRQVMICVVLTVYLTTTATLFVGSQSYAIPSFVRGTLGSGPYSVELDRLLAFIIGALILVAIQLFVTRTRWGMQMQAIAQNREGAALQGIGIRRIAIIICALGCALAAIAGVLVGVLYSLTPFMGQNTLVKILALVILAGVGSFQGIYIMGLILGLLYAALPILAPGNLGDAIAVVTVCIILLLRPQGFFGHEA